MEAHYVTAHLNELLVGQICFGEIDLIENPSKIVLGAKAAFRNRNDVIKARVVAWDQKLSSDCAQATLLLPELLKHCQSTILQSEAVRGSDVLEPVPETESPGGSPIPAVDALTVANSRMVLLSIDLQANVTTLTARLVWAPTLPTQPLLHSTMDRVLRGDLAFLQAHRTEPSRGCSWTVQAQAFGSTLFFVRCFAERGHFPQTLTLVVLAVLPTDSSTQSEAMGRTWPLMEGGRTPVRSALEDRTDTKMLGFNG